MTRNTGQIDRMLRILVGMVLLYLAITCLLYTSDAADE